MAQEAVVIPEKIYFKIGEVCELVGVQAHVLRYWETEFSTLSPQKNKSGQRSYRRRDVEIALRIKQLLYNEMFTIAGARKKLQSELRDGSRSKSGNPAVSEPRSISYGPTGAPLLFDAGFQTEGSDSADTTTGSSAEKPQILNGSDHKDAIRTVASHLLELREMLRNRVV